jgi:holo-[acyl-carrier protein] synthase
MRVIGHGIDLTEVARVADLLDRHGGRFLARCFTPDEVAYSRRRPQRTAEHLAARFAAKEAVLKALGTGRRHGIAWTDIEVTRDPHGVPGVRLTGIAAEIARQAGITQWHLTLTHTQSMAAASAIAVGV